MGRYRDMPRLRTVDDYQALTQTVDAYQKAVAKEIQRGDFNAALVANHLAAKFADYQASMAASNREAIKSLRTYGNGRMDLAPGAYVVLPAFDRYDPPRKFSFNDWPYGEAQQVAANDFGTKLDALGGILRAINGPQEKKTPNAAPPATMNVQQALSLPLNQPVTLLNGAVLERTKDSFVLHNPGTYPIQIDLQSLGYLPPIRTPSPSRLAAGSILFNINSTTGDPVIAGITDNVDIAPPNRILYDKGGKRTGGLRVDGDFARTPDDVATSKREYEKAGSPFRLAVDARYAMQRSKERNNFVAQCTTMSTNMSGSFYFLDRMEGAYGEVIDLRCFRRRAKGETEGEVVYSRRYFVTDNGQIKSWESLLLDKDTAAQLDRMDNLTDAVENLVGLLPIVGNAENGLKCADQTTITARARNLLSDKSALLDQKRAFVTDIYDINAKDSAIDRASNCAGALPLLGNASKFGLKTAQLANFGKYVDSAGKDIAIAMNFFDSGLRSGAKWEAVAAQMGRSIATEGSQAMKYAKTAYDTLQNGKSLSDLASSVTTISRI